MKKGFTLAEVLITLTIIGVIAALTIPTLIKNYNDYIIITRLKKAQNILSNITTELFNEYNPPRGITRAQAAYICLDGPCNGGSAKNSNEIANFIFSRMKIKYNCGFKNNGWEDTCSVGELKTKNLNGKIGIYSSGHVYPYQHYLVLTEDGMSYALKTNDWAIEGMPSERGVGEASDKGYIWIWVDINGKQGPNTAGKDIFAFGITSHGLYPMGYNEKNVLPSNVCNKNNDGSTCAGKILREGKISY